MKGIKKGLFLLLFIFSLFILNNSAKAYIIHKDEYHNYVLNEDKVYQDFSSIDGFDINKYSNMHCNIVSDYMQNCFALTDEIVESLIKVDNILNFDNPPEDCMVYYVSYLNYGSQVNTYTFSCDERGLNFANKNYSNFDFPFYTEEENANVNVLDFSSYMEPDDPEDETDQSDLEITIKATNILNFMLDKTKNIYEVIINNQIFKLCIGVLLSYLIFMVICRLMKK